MGIVGDKYPITEGLTAHINTAKSQIIEVNSLQNNYVNNDPPPGIDDSVAYTLIHHLVLTIQQLTH